MHKYSNETGKRYGRLTVVSAPYQKIVNNKNHVFVQVLCDYDDITREPFLFELRNSNLIKENGTKSCGCLKEDHINKVIQNNTKHNLSKHPLFGVHGNMMNRCYNFNNVNYYRYGERGITVHLLWHDFIIFYNWAIEAGWREGLTLERIDNDKGYCPENCKWVTQKEQCNNRRSNRFITAFGETKTLAQWCEDERCSTNCHDTIAYRIRKGWSPEDAISKPLLREYRGKYAKK